MAPTEGHDPPQPADYKQLITFSCTGLALYHIIYDLGRSCKVSTLAQDYSSLLARDSL